MLKACSLSDSSCRGIVDRMHWMRATVKPSDAEPLPVGIRNGSKNCRNRRAGRSGRIGRLQQIATVCEQSATICNFGKLNLEKDTIPKAWRLRVAQARARLPLFGSFSVSVRRLSWESCPPARTPNAAGVQRCEEQRQRDGRTAVIKEMAKHRAAYFRSTASRAVLAIN